MKKTTLTSTQFNKSRLQLKRMLKDKSGLYRGGSSSSDELSPNTNYLWKRAIHPIPRFEDDYLGPPDEDIELIACDPVNRLKPLFGLRIYKNISEKGKIITPNWTLDNGTFNPEQYGKGGHVDTRGMGTFKFINQSNLNITLVIKSGERIVLPSPKMSSHFPALPTFIELPFEENHGGIAKDVMGSRIIRIVPGGVPPDFYQSAFNILDSDGPNPLYVLYENK
ncbi:MAG: hypothetical protein CL779_03165 [Chloroflexi bacterium]|nr:hypothetical protein [Chloroflexota bacterium]